jgi:hypothetical protein
MVRRVHHTHADQHRCGEDMLDIMRVRFIIYISYIIYIMLWVIVYVTPMLLLIIVETVIVYKTLTLTNIVAMKTCSTLCG